ncbi:hypothetical protein [Oceanobacillus locisalsi]|uniref:Uncharacterized protein n=1 Tax=Oceanobacillus locisalsi TaxID=546107 RepID=A0ABW3NHH0_9BACI
MMNQSAGENCKEFQVVFDVILEKWKSLFLFPFMENKAYRFSVMQRIGKVIFL